MATRQATRAKCFLYYISRTALLVENQFYTKILKCFIMTSVIRQKGESQNECFKKTKHAKFSENEHFLSPESHTYMCVSESKKSLFFRKLGVLCFLETPVLRLPFCLVTNDIKSAIAEDISLRDIFWFNFHFSRSGIAKCRYIECVRKIFFTVFKDNDLSLHSELVHQFFDNKAWFCWMENKW